MASVPLQQVYLQGHCLDLALALIWNKILPWNLVSFIRLNSEGDEGSFGPPYPRDLDDFGEDGCGTGGPSRAMPTNPLELFIQKLLDLSTMNIPDISAVLDDLAVLQRGEVAGISMQEAVAVCCLTQSSNSCTCRVW
jgi:hypothetical protein